MAHEINNPLTILMGNLEFLKAIVESEKIEIDILKVKIDELIEKAEVISEKVDKLGEIDAKTVDSMDTGSDNFELKRKSG